MKLVAAVLAVAAMTATVGCGVQGGTVGGEPVGASLSGRVHGGQQPVANATVQLYAVGTTGDGSAATALLSPAVTTDANGNFSLSPGGTALYSCTNATEVYLVATGGNPGGSTANPNLAMMTALGPCSALTTSGFIWVNELTTVAATQALAPYMTGYANVGSGSGDAAALASAFTTAAELVNPSNGTTPGLNVPSGYTVPVTLLNTLADIVASCINSTGGVATDTSTNCGSLFSLTTPQGQAAPTDTVGALVYLAQNPTMNTGALFGLVPANAPFQPTATVAPPDFRERLTPSSSAGYVLQVEPTALSFPPTMTGSTSQQIVLLENSGGGSITVNSVGVTGTNAGDFSETNTCTMALSSDSSCTVTVTFAPTATGTRTAYLAIASTSPDSPQYVSLTGNGAAPGVAAGQLMGQFYVLDPVGVSLLSQLTNVGNTPIAMGAVTDVTGNSLASDDCPASLAGGATCNLILTLLSPGMDEIDVASSDPSSPTKVYTWTSNTTTAASDAFFPSTVVGSSNTQPLTVGQLSSPIAGPNASDFTVTSTCTPTPSVPCSIYVKFTPSAPGLRTARLEINASSPNVYVPLMGYGLASAPSAQQTLTPASVNLVDMSGPQTLTLTNYANSAISITSTSVQTPFLASEFQVANVNCGTSLPAQSICTLKVNSTRTTAGTTQGLLMVSGDFGTLSVPVTSTVDTIKNFGAAPLANCSTCDLVMFPGTTGSYYTSDSFSGVTSGADPGDFVGNPSNCTKYEGNPCQIGFNFSPQVEGTRTATLTATSTYSGTTYFMLTGLGIGPDTPPTSSFSLAGNTYDNSSIAPVPLQNTGTTTLNLTAPSFSGPGASYFSVYNNGCSTLPIGAATCGITLAANSTSQGLFMANLNFANGSGPVVSQPVYLLATPPPTVSPSTLSFPDTPPGQVSAPLTATITPRPGQTISYVTSSLSYGSTGFQITKGNCGPGESPCTVEVVFAPPAAGTYLGSADLEVYPVSSLGLTLSGKTPVTNFGTASVSPGSLAFPARPANSISISQPVTLSNTGTATFNITSIGLGGTNAGEFSMTTNCGASLTAGSSCTINVTFQPTTTGDKSASITITGDSTAGLPISVGLTGSAY